MKTYLVGRNPRTVQILIPESEISVSREHLELTENSQGNFYLTNRGTNGTYCQRAGQWIKLDKGYVAADELLRLGTYQTTVRQLLALRIEIAHAQLENVHLQNVEKRVLKGALERDEYGNIVQKS